MKSIFYVSDKAESKVPKTKRMKRARALAAKLVEKFGLWAACLQA
jgi:hypothetical protein